MACAGPAVDSTPLYPSDIPIATARASSVLNRNARLHGAAHVLDDSDGGWNSDAGSPQELELTLTTPALLSELRITFQGGFTGQACELQAHSAPAQGSATGQTPITDLDVAVCSSSSSSSSQRQAEWACIARFDPDDVNGEQAFAVDACSAATARVRIAFPRSTDFYGRVVVYRVRLLGWPVGPATRASVAPPAEAL